MRTKEEKTQLEMLTAVLRAACTATPDAKRTTYSRLHDAREDGWQLARAKEITRRDLPRGPHGERRWVSLVVVNRNDNRYLAGARWELCLVSSEWVDMPNYDGGYVDEWSIRTIMTAEDVWLCDELNNVNRPGVFAQMFRREDLIVGDVALHAVFETGMVNIEALGAGAGE